MDRIFVKVKRMCRRLFNMKKTLIVVDMQNDFIDMALGTKEAVAIVPKVKKKISISKVHICIWLRMPSYRSAL